MGQKLFCGIYNHIKQHWAQLLSSFLLGFIFLDIARYYHFSQLSKIEKIRSSLPPVKDLYLLLFIFIILGAVWLYKYWCRYKNAYTLKQTPFFIVEGLVLFLIPASYHFRNEILKGPYLILFVALIIFLLSTYVAAFVSVYQKETQEDSEDEAYLDEPITKPEQDRFSRAKFITELKTEIYKKGYERAFVIGLYGKWGEGKTSILNLLKNQIVEDNKAIVYEFDPWYFENPEAIITNFYQGLEDLISERYALPSEIRKILKGYPKVLIKGIVDISMDFGSEDRPDKIKKKLESYLSNLEKPILVLIDDIDRLQPTEILTVLRLVKLTSHMKNIIFVLAFDPTILTNSLEKVISEPSKYIEKIIQHQAIIPKTDQNEINKYLLYSFPNLSYTSAVDKILDTLHVSQAERDAFDKEFVHIYDTQLVKLFGTLRSAKGYLRSLRFRLKFIPREVNLYDFFVLDIFQYFFPSVYLNIQDNKEYYLSPGFFSLLSLRLSTDDRKRHEEIRQHIDRLLQRSENKDNADLILALLKSLFPEVKNAYEQQGQKVHMSDNYRFNKRIGHPECFDKYFMLSVRADQIPDAEIEEEIQHWEGSEDKAGIIQNAFFGKYQKSGNLLELFQKLKLFANKFSHELAVALIKVIYSNTAKLSKKDKDVWVNEFEQGCALIFFSVENGQTFQGNLITETIKQVVQEADTFDFVMTVVYYTINTGNLYKIEQSVDRGEIKEAALDRLKKYFFQGEHDIFAEYPEPRQFAFILYQWATHWENKEENDKEVVNNYLLKLIDKTPKYLGKLLLVNVKNNSRSEGVLNFNLEDFGRAYDGAKFYELAKKLKIEDTYSNEEEKRAVELFMEKFNSPQAKTVV